MDWERKASWLVVCVHVGVQISIHRNDRALMVFTQGPKNTWIMMETNSLRERKQTLKFFFSYFLLWLNTSLSLKGRNYIDQVWKIKIITDKTTIHLWWLFLWYLWGLGSLFPHRKAYQWFTFHLCAQSIRTGTTLYMQRFESERSVQLPHKLQ